jgi:inosose dehydratase
MIEVSSKAGMSGIELIFSWMGDLTDPAKLADCLQQHNIELAAVAFSQNWNDRAENAEEREEADRAIELLTHFPGGRR